MESRLRDHLANERTFLAWLRTGVAVIAFGFVVDRFSLYVHYLVPAATTLAVPSTSLPTAVVGAGLMWAGTLLIPIALWRFLSVQRDIDQSGVMRPRKWFVVIFAGLVTAIGIYLSFVITGMG
jgi:putative membrane protein